MPVAEFPGRFGWGYDGVDLFAPTRLYGQPDDFRRFVDQAHALGLAVILDVVYNHLGPDGNYLGEFSADYITDRYPNEWGDALNFDGPNAGPVREFVVANAGYWVAEYHLDGLRLDATQSIYDQSPVHVLAEIGAKVREAAAGRATIVVAENEPQQVRLVGPAERGGYGLDALWNDDFHHSATVALTGHNEAYYSDYHGCPQEFVSAVKYGYLYQGQHYRWQGKPRGSPTFGVPPAAFVNYLQNHDQIANSGLGRRAHALASPGTYRAMTALLLLLPQTPLLFMGQEFGASSPFLYFADHQPDLARSVRQGRAEFLAQFPSLATPEVQALLPGPGDPSTFARCKLEFAERASHAPVYRLHRDLLALRRDDPIFRAQRPGGVDGAMLAPDAFVLRFFADDHRDDRLLLVNLGPDLHLREAPEPLLAPPPGRRWALRWSSEDPSYGGDGTAPILAPDPHDADAAGGRPPCWNLPGRSGVVLVPVDEGPPPG
jgi:maltooligosyltrehalose trehalohydrolase